MNKQLLGITVATVLIGSLGIASLTIAKPAIKSAPKIKQTQSTVTTNIKTQPKVTFIELGSVNCVPCKMMQPVMDDIKKEYAGKVRVVFHDVWTPAGEAIGKKYGIRAIPTQIILDASGKEFFRHEGFFPKDQLKIVIEEALVK